MKGYLSIPVIRELLRRIEDDPEGEEDETAATVLASAILNHYFTPWDGFVVIPEHVPREEEDGYPDSTLFHVQRLRYSSEKQKNDFKPHIVAQALSPFVPEHCGESIARLKDKAEGSDVSFIRCHAILFRGEYVIFYGNYRYIRNYDGATSYVYEKGGTLEYRFHLRDETYEIYRVLRQIVWCPVSSSVYGGRVIDT